MSDYTMDEVVVCDHNCKNKLRWGLPQLTELNTERTSSGGALPLDDGQTFGTES